MRDYPTMPPSEAANRLNYSGPRYIQEIAKAGEIPGAYQTVTGRWLIPAAWVEWRKFIDNIGHDRDKGGRQRGKIKGKKSSAE